MVLVGDGEGEARAQGRTLPKLILQLPDQDGVGLPDRGHRVYKGAVVVFREPVVLKAQILIDILPVIEPPVARMAAEGLIALIPEIPDIGAGGGTEIVMLRIAGEEGPLGVHRSPGEDVGQQIAGDGPGLQLVPGGVDLGHPLLAGQNLKIGEVAEGLQHDSHNRYLLTLRDAAVGVCVHLGGGLGLAVAGGGRGEHILEGVQEGIDTALGYKDLHVGPRVDKLGAAGFAVERRAEAGACQGHSHQGPAAQRSEGPLPPSPDSLRHQKDAEQQPGEEAAQGKPHQPGQVQSVAPHDAPGLGGQPQIGGQQGVGAQANLVVVGQGDADGGEKAAQKARPGPP